MDLWNEVGLIWRLFTTDSKAESLPLHELVVGVGLVGIASWGDGLMEEVYLFGGADGGSPAGELTAVVVEGDRALGVIILESFGFGEAEG